VRHVATSNVLKLRGGGRAVGLETTRAVKFVDAADQVSEAWQKPSVMNGAATV
jgi:hypothetical protein